MPNQQPITNDRSTIVRWSILQIGIGTADELEIQPVRILDEDIADRLAPFHELAIAGEDAPAGGLVLGKQVANMADAQGHSARVGIGHAQIEYLRG